MPTLDLFHDDFLLVREKHVSYLKEPDTAKPTGKQPSFSGVEWSESFGTAFPLGFPYILFSCDGIRMKIPVLAHSF